MGEPVGSKTATDQAEYAGGQIGAVHPGQQQKAVIVEHQVQIAPALGARPANEARSRSASNQALPPKLKPPNSREPLNRR